MSKQLPKLGWRSIDGWRTSTQSDSIVHLMSGHKDGSHDVSDINGDLQIQPFPRVLTCRLVLAALD